MRLSSVLPVCEAALDRCAKLFDGNGQSAVLDPPLADGLGEGFGLDLILFEQAQPRADGQRGHVNADRHGGGRFGAGRGGRGWMWLGMAEGHAGERVVLVNEVVFQRACNMEQDGRGQNAFEDDVQACGGMRDAVVDRDTGQALTERPPHGRKAGGGRVMDPAREWHEDK